MLAAKPMREKGSLRDLIILAWPMMIGMLSYTVMDFTDAIIAGRLGKLELAAVGIATTVLFLLHSFFIGFFESVKILVSQATGAKNSKIAFLY